MCRLNGAADDYADSAITAAQLIRGIKRARSALRSVEERLVDAGRVSVLVDLVTADDVQLSGR